MQLQGTHLTISNAAIYLRLESDGQTLDIYYNNTGTGTPAATYVLANLASVAASSSGSQLTVDFSNGSPVPAGSALSYNATGAGNTIEIIGTSGNDTIVIIANSASVGNSSFTYRDVQNRVVDPLTGSDSLTIGSNVTASFPVAPAADISAQPFAGADPGHKASILLKPPKQKRPLYRAFLYLAIPCGIP